MPMTDPVVVPSGLPAQDPTPADVVDEIVDDALTPEGASTVEDWVSRWLAPGGGE